MPTQSEYRDAIVGSYAGRTAAHISQMLATHPNRDLRGHQTLSCAAMRHGPESPLMYVVEERTPDGR
ncbi:MAG TPA: hypothetical protein VFN11_09835 [Ktedonobacterales bacterium]|nr:hypothetical protein [Ktedonobacterales bacterium]